MPRHFDPQLVNGPFGDPALYIDLAFERRALLFDLGDLASLSPRKLLRISDVFVSHRHMDHFIGFDQLLRCLLGREKTVGIWGSPGLIDAVECKLNAYTWNLVAGYEGNLVLKVSELLPDGCIKSARFCGAHSFAREDLLDGRCEDGVLLSESGFQVRTAVLDHGIPVLAFALEERAGINILRNHVEEMGLRIGPWLRGFKDAIVGGEPDDAPIDVVWADSANDRPRSLPLRLLKSRIMKITTGRKIAYVVDAAYNDRNVDAIVRLASDADVLFIEATFLDAEADRALVRNHLTARQAGLLARRAKVRQLRTFHHSPRYQGRAASLELEAHSAFTGGT